MQLPVMSKSTNIKRETKNHNRLDKSTEMRVGKELGLKNDNMDAPMETIPASAMYSM